MNRPRKRIALRVESLEVIALLSGIPGVPVVSASASGSATGLGGVGSVTTDEAQALQQDASGGFLEQYISEVEALHGSRANVRQYAKAVVADHQVTSFDLQETAATVGVTLPTGIALPTDVRDAQEVLGAVRGRNLDRTYLQVMEQINSQDVAADRRLAFTSHSGSIDYYVQEAFGYDVNHARGANQLLQKPGSTYSPAFPTFSVTPPFDPLPNFVPPSASDVQALRMDESGGSLEQFISQVEELRGTRGDAQQYAQSVVGDHQVTNFDLRDTARGQFFTLPSGITDASDIQDARQVLDAVRHGNLDRAYLQVMAKINAQDVASGQQLIATTQNPGVLAYAQETLSYDMTHLQGAQMLLKQQSYTYTPGG